jgi:hypothetical protein
LSSVVTGCSICSRVMRMYSAISSGAMRLKAQLTIVSLPTLTASTMSLNALASTTQRAISARLSASLPVST